MAYCNSYYYNSNILRLFSFTTPPPGIHRLVHIFKVEYYISKIKVILHDTGDMNVCYHHLMVIHPCAKYGLPMSNQKEVTGRIQKCIDSRMDGQTV